MVVAVDRVGWEVVVTPWEARGKRAVGVGVGRGGSMWRVSSRKHMFRTD